MARSDRPKLYGVREYAYSAIGAHKVGTFGISSVAQYANKPDGNCF